MNLSEPILAECCPLCSRFKKEHPDVLLEDILVFPSIRESRHRKGAWFIGRCCEHAEGLFGPHDSEEIAKQLWSERVTKLRAEKEQRRKELEQSLARINESKTVPSLAVVTRTAASMVKERSAEARNELQQLDDHATEPRATDAAHGATKKAGDESGSVGDETALSEMCEVGSNMWMNHKLNIKGVCERCGAKIL